MRGLLFLFAFLALPFSAHADPEILLTRAGEGVDVTVSDLDANQSYWITLVPTSAELGAYTSFHYLTGPKAAQVHFDDPGPGQIIEIRLHKKSAGNPLLARSALTAPAQETKAADPYTLAFARKYGLAGKWRGRITCSQGIGEFEVTLRPHFYENGYLGDLHLTLIGGPDKGKTGVWPLLAQVTPANGSITLTANSPISVPVEGYKIPQIFGTTLSADRLRVENADLQSHTCTEFTFERVPLPLPQQALAATKDLASAGFLGQWQGSYNCGVETALDLTMDADPVSGLTLARWGYRGNGFEGEILFHAEAAGVGEISLMPLQWVVHPYRHQALPVTFSIAPDGAAMQGAMAGCGPVTVSRTKAAADPPPTLLGDAAQNTIARMAGLWSGFAQCNGAEHLLELTLPDLIGEGGNLDFRYFETGKLAGTTHLVLGAQLGDPIALTLVEQRSGPLNQQSFEPASLTLQDAGLLLSFAQGCDDTTLNRADPPPAFAAIPGHAGQGALLVAQSGDTTLSVAPPAEICSAVANWVRPLSAAEARMTRAGSWVSDYGGWPMLFQDRYFEPVFGLPYAQLSASPAVGQALIAPLRKTCGDLGVEDLHLRTALSLAFGVERNSALFASKAHRFRLAVAKARQNDAEALRLTKEITALPLIPASGAVIPGLHDRLAALPLLETDRAELAAILNERSAQITAMQSDAFLSALADGTEPTSSQGFIRANAILQDRSAQERAHWIERLDGVAQTLAGQVEDASDTELASLQQLTLFPPIANTIARIEQNRRSAQAEARSALQDRIARVTRIEDLQPLLSQLRQHFGSDAQILAGYNAKARALLAKIVSAAPVPDLLRVEPVLSGGNLANLRQNALITAFLTGDRIAAYRADRDATMLYLQRLTRVFRDYCPAALPPELPQLVTGYFIDLNALTGSRDQVAAQGLNAIVEGLGMLADPGAAMSRAMRQDEIFATADGDAQILLRNLDCTGNELRSLFENARRYVINPADGVPVEALAMADICLVALDDGMIMNTTRSYCRCAGPFMDRSSADMQTYLRMDPARHFRQIAFVDPALHRSLQGCRR
ncbi:hypothetical protein [Pseudorhodobacter aquimaris]|uniref:hypothetical protein n=1 Tax=Pseudorhodobacter aquimaris TaxID=687412 RepID=UPI00067BC949|nr:hypothetical protein [Pseudorhodobacter aquimaris]